MMDKFGTIGSLPCERSLNAILAEREDPSLVRKVTRLLFRLRECLKGLKDIKDDRVSQNLRILVRRDVESKLSAITGVKLRGVPTTDVIASHTMCVIKAYFATL